MRAQELMTDGPACVTPDDSARRAAELMADHDCGALPVLESRDSDRVVGVITDRDIAVRAVGQGKGPDVPVRELMTAGPACCTASASVQEIERVMSDRQIRRVVIVDDDGCCVGIVAQADLARAAERGRGVADKEVARVVERISAPTQASTGAGRRSERSPEQQL